MVELRHLFYFLVEEDWTMGEKIVRFKRFIGQTKECMAVFLFLLLLLRFLFSNWVRNVIEKQQERNVPDSSISQYQSFENNGMESYYQLFATKGGKP